MGETASFTAAPPLMKEKSAKLGPKTGRKCREKLRAGWMEMVLRPRDSWAEELRARTLRETHEY